MAELDTAALTAAIASAENTAQQPTDPTSYPIAIRTLRHAIRSLEVPESKTGALHLFDLGKW